MLPSVVLATLVVVAGISDRAGRPGAVALAGVSLLWLVVNHTMEGQVLVVVSPTHGLVSADLAGLAGFALATWVWFRRRPASRPNSPNSP